MLSSYFYLLLITSCFTKFTHYSVCFVIPVSVHVLNNSLVYSSFLNDRSVHFSTFKHVHISLP